MKEAKAKNLKGEITKLREKLTQQKTTKIGEDPCMKFGTDGIQPANARMSIMPNDAAYLLVMESQIPIVYFLA
jgi:hypothetical protein